MALRVGVLGLGTAGLLVAARIIQDKKMSLVLAVRRAGSRYIGWDIGKFLKRKRYGVRITDANTLDRDIRKNKPVVLVDFTNPESCLRNIETAAANGVNVVVGTTGFGKNQLRRLESFGERIGLVIAPNITEGICIWMMLARTVAHLWPDADIDVIETHHRRKTDFPSGTARMLVERILHDDAKMRYLPGASKRERKHDVRVHSIRAGGVISEHRIQFATQTQTLEIRHSTIFRDAFGSGALKAARFIATKRNGVYHMEDVLGLGALKPDGVEAQNL
jgi:4-hydroxy-tetrahydrodipicolinate reductase